MSLPIFKDDNKNIMLLQNAWSSTLNPIIASPPNQSLVLKNVSLVSGSNNVNHMLGRKLQGWKLVRQRSAGTVYDNQDSNTTPQLTLILVASANINADIEVF